MARERENGKRHYPVNKDRIQRERDDVERGDTEYWKPKVGPNVIRILPPWSEEGVYFKAGRFHYRIGPNKRTVYCLRDVNKPCFLCEEYERTRNSDNKKLAGVAKELRSRKRFFTNIIDRNDEKSGVQIFAFGIEIHKEVLEYFSDPEYGDPTDPKDGYNFQIRREGEKLDTEYFVRISKNPSPLGNKEWLEQIKDLDKFFKVYSYAEQQEIYEGAIPGEEKEREETPSTEKRSAGSDEFGDDRTGDPPPKRRPTEEPPARGQGRSAKEPEDEFGESSRKEESSGRRSSRSEEASEFADGGSDDEKAIEKRLRDAADGGKRSRRDRD